ncbi:hypothetical protein [Brevibacterium zhoupengii]|uniref:hypothetical protein n=1 Tax=Brevibacterium zhoupengii TaxID=2898795 RepID=UPI001F09F3D4|nr:hypothetical protein [Brevibacterium zhoupengii]
MCLAKSEPNYFRCDWKNATAKQLADLLAREAITLEATVLVDALEPGTLDVYDSVLNRLKGQLADAIGTLSTKDVDEVRKSLRKPPRRKLGKGHLVCAIAASIGKACKEITTIPTSLAKSVGKAVTHNTGSQLLGKVSELAVQKWLPTLTATTPLGQLKQVGLIADTIAVCTCPGQQDRGNPGTHPEVVDCEARLRGAAVRAEVKGLLDQASSR